MFVVWADNIEVTLRFLRRVTQLTVRTVTLHVKVGTAAAFSEAISTEEQSTDLTSQFGIDTSRMLGSAFFMTAQSLPIYSEKQIKILLNSNHYPGIGS